LLIGRGLEQARKFTWDAAAAELEGLVMRTLDGLAAR
jgi:hypothetical protein